MLMFKTDPSCPLPSLFLIHHSILIPDRVRRLLSCINHLLLFLFICLLPPPELALPVSFLLRYCCEAVLATAAQSPAW